jgi:hypothetical protein
MEITGVIEKVLKELELLRTTKSGKTKLYSS